MEQLAPRHQVLKRHEEFRGLRYDQRGSDDPESWPDHLFDLSTRRVPHHLSARLSRAIR
jgi:hypothetical protein